MNAFINILKREIKKLKSNKFIMLNVFLAPLLFSIIVIWTFSSGTLKNLPIAVLDMDNSDITRMITRSVNACPAVGVVTPASFSPPSLPSPFEGEGREGGRLTLQNNKYKISDINEGYDLIKSGKVYAFLVFPKDFKKDLNRGDRPQISYYYNNQMILIGSTITKDVQAAVTSVLNGVDVQTRMKQGLAKDAALTKINLIQVDERVKSNPYLNYSYFLVFAALAHVYQVFITLTAIWSLGVEFREGTTNEWLMCSNGSILKAVFGKLFLYGGIFFILMMISFIGYIILYKAPFEGNLFFFTISSVIYIFAYQMMGLFFTSILSNLRFALSSGAFYTSLGFTFAGMTFPAIAMPIFGRFYSSLLPVRPYVNLIVDQIMKGLEPKYDLIYVFWMLLIGLFGFCFIPLLKKHAQDEKLCYQI